jgi:putative membrane protein
VVNNSRSLSRGLMALCTDPQARRSLTHQQIAYVLALRCHLLGLPPAGAIAGYLAPETAETVNGAKNVPAAIQFAMARGIAGSRAAGALDSISAAALNTTLGDLANAQGGLERIKNTPLPRQFSHLPQVFTRIYCILLPIGLVSDLGINTPVGSTVIGFLFLALDRIGADLEDPFGNDVHDIPMEAISRTVEIDLLQSLDAGQVPDPVTPVDGILR